MKRSLYLVAVAAAMVSQQAAANERKIAFIDCPIFRDTSTVPCWLSRHEGQMYYLGIQTDVSAELTPPSLGHRALVEGTVTDKPEICGGKVLENVTISVMPGQVAECNTLLMAEARYELPFVPPRPPGPSAGRLAFNGTLEPARQERAVPAAPFSEKTFTVPYDFEGTVGFRTPRFLTPVLEYAQQVGASKIEVTGYRAGVQLSNGQLATEHDGIATRRVDEIITLLRGAGLTSPEYSGTAIEEPDIGGPEKRRVIVRVVPGK